MGRQDVLKWTPMQSETFISLQGVTYFAGPLLTGPLMRNYGGQATTLIGHLCSVLENVTRGLVPGEGALGNALWYAQLLPGMPGNVGLRLSGVMAELTREGQMAGIPRGELHAAVQSFASCVRLFAPLVYLRVYLALRNPARMW